MRGMQRRARARAGFSLIEIVVAIAVLGVVMSSLSSVFDSTRDTYQQGATVSQAQTAARRGIGRIAGELENGGIGTLLPSPIGVANSDMVFQVARGVDPLTGSIQFEPGSRLRWAVEPSELNNGLDDDGDGLVDEGRVLLTRNFLQADELTVVVARGVSELLEGELPNGIDDNGNGFSDEPGFCMTLQGSLLILRLTTERMSADRRSSVSTVETAVRLKN